MVLNLGDVAAGSTLYVPFATYSSSGASVTITGLAVADIKIYKNGSVTQRSSNAGYALLGTNGIDFAGILGIHGFSIDLSNNTDAGFYAAGSTYWLVVSAITVDSQTVSFVYYFTIDKANVLRPTTAGRTLDVAATGEAGLDFNNVLSTSLVTLNSLTITGATTFTGATVHTGNVSMAAGLTITQSTTNGHGITATGNGTGAGLRVVGGATGAGLNAVGSAAGILATGGATGAGMSLVGGTTSGLGLAIDYTAPIGAVKELGILESGTMQVGSTSTTAVLRAAASFADDLIIGATLAITGGTGSGQSRLITDWANSSKTATVPAWTTTPDNTSVYEVYRTAAGSGSEMAATLAAALSIKAKTDLLTFTVANQVDANTESMNAAPVLGDGSSGNKWRGA
jgi:hypothetical protein